MKTTAFVKASSRKSQTKSDPVIRAMMARKLGFLSVSYLADVIQIDQTVFTATNKSRRCSEPFPKLPTRPTLNRVGERHNFMSVGLLGC
mmetsp:Transcript_9982/g.30483  ORF Transcript_9982/g.30483 Transcript_9982/m.30483 type:complete len:89 (+) Transcript_9982:1233-1499(+)